MCLKLMLWGVIRHQQHRRRPRQSAGEVAGVNRRQRTKTSRLVRRHFNAHICSSANLTRISKFKILNSNINFEVRLTSLLTTYETITLTTTLQQQNPTYLVIHQQDSKQQIQVVVLHSHNLPQFLAATYHICGRNNRNTHTCLMDLCLGLPGWASTRKVKPIWILLKQETVSGSGISWAICKSVPRSRQITMPAPHHSVFYRPDALRAARPTAPDQQRQST